MVAQSEAFQTAVVDSKKLTSKPSNDDLLEMYGTSSTSIRHLCSDGPASACLNSN